MVNDFVSYYGRENLHILKTSHGGVPSSAFGEDKDKNNKSDLIEWLLS